MKESKAYAHLAGWIRGLNLNASAIALKIMRDAHAGQTRKGGGPYEEHPIQTACLLASIGITDDHVIAAALLHDAKEESRLSDNDLAAMGMPAPVVVSVGLLTKPGHLDAAGEDAYYAAIAKDFGATFAKLGDRTHNLSTMCGAFTIEKIHSYLCETDERVIPLARLARRTWVPFSNQAWILEQHLRSMVQLGRAFEEAVKCG